MLSYVSSVLNTREKTKNEPQNQNSIEKQTETEPQSKKSIEQVTKKEPQSNKRIEKTNEKWTLERKCIDKTKEKGTPEQERNGKQSKNEPQSKIVLENNWKMNRGTKKY